MKQYKKETENKKEREYRREMQKKSGAFLAGDCRSERLRTNVAVERTKL